MNDRTERGAELRAWDETRLNEAFRALASRRAPESLADETIDAIERERVLPSIGVRHAPRFWGAVAGLAACLALVAGTLGFVALRQGPAVGGGDGFPAKVSGLAVVSVGEAVKAERATTTDELLAVRGWLEASLVPSCPAPMPGRSFTALEVCGGIRYMLLDRAEPAVHVSHSSDSTSISCCTFRGDHLWVHAPELTDLSAAAGLDSGAVDRFPVVPVVLVGHFHDVRAQDCVTDGRETCGQVFVADQLAWVHGQARGPSVTVTTDAAGNPLEVHSTAAQAEAAVRNAFRVDAIVSATAVTSSSLHSVGASATWGRAPGAIWFVRFAGPPPINASRAMTGSSGWAIVDDGSGELASFGGWNLIESMSRTASAPGSGAPQMSGSPLPSGARPSVSTAPATSAPTPTMQVSLPPSASPSAACTPDQLRAAPPTTAGGASGQQEFFVTLTNIGAAPCSLFGWPGEVRLLAKDGSRLDVQFEHSSDIAAAALLILEPGASGAAGLEMWWGNWCGTEHVGSIVVLLGTGTASIAASPAPDVLPRCDNRDSPSTLSVGPFMPVAP